MSFSCVIVLLSHVLTPQIAENDLSAVGVVTGMRGRKSWIPSFGLPEMTNLKGLNKEVVDIYVTDNKLCLCLAIRHVMYMPSYIIKG